MSDHIEVPAVDLTQKPFNLSTIDQEWVAQIFDTLDIQEKVGQIFMPDTDVGTKSKLRDLLQYKPCGVFMSMGALSFKGYQQKGINFLQVNSSIPMLITGDLELGGLGGALNATPYSSQMGVAATNDDLWAYRMGIVVGSEGAAMGYNWVFSPVVDINYNYQNPLVHLRSFGDDPQKVLRMSLAYIKGVQESGVAATAKHFPGDGMDDRDQHLITSKNSLSMEQWNNSYGMVYRGLIDAGVKTVMSAHITFPAYSLAKNPQMKLQNIKPGSLSAELNINLLRKELGFNGVIVSDASGMLGFTTQGKRDDIIPQIIANGCDVLLFGRPNREDFQRLLQGVETGIISKQRLDDAVRRVLGLKASLNLHQRQRESTLIQPKLALKTVGCFEHNQWARECAQKSITLVKDTQNLLPLSPTTHKRVLIIRRGEFLFFTRTFMKQMKKRGFHLTDYKSSMHVTPDQYDLVLYLINQMGLNRSNSVRLKWREWGLNRWFGYEIPTMFISLANPYHLYEMPMMKTYINTYGPFPFIQDELVRMLVGEIPFQGVSPIDAFCNSPEIEFF
jgi:beta-N-acetylhexosaminidase